MKQQASQAPLDEGVGIGDYVIQRALGHDGQGYRYLARGRSGSCILHELFPLQVVRRGDAGVEAVDPGDRSALRWWTRSYLDRARLFAAARHPALATIDASFEAGGTAWHASRPPTGAPLSELLEQDRRFDAATLQRLLADVLDALAAVHALGLVHRAIDPRQIWLHPDGSAMLRGFGSLRGSLRLHAQVIHSVAAPPYAAPEEVAPDAPVGAAADLYALAAMAWQLVSGQPPPDVARRDAAPSLKTLAGDDWPVALLDGIERAFDPDPLQRPSAQDWRASLPAAVSPARRAVTVTPPPAPTQRSILVPLAASMAVLAGLGLGAWWWLRPAPPATPVAIAVATPAAATMPATALNRPRFMPTSLSVEDGGPAPDQAALERISEEAPQGQSETDTEVSPAPVAPAPVAATPPVPVVTATSAPQRSAATPAPTAVPPNARDAIAIAANATPPPRPAPSASPSAADGIEVAALQPVAAPSLSPEQAAQIEAEERARAKAQQLALERSRCDRHVSELFANREFTYADIAGFDDVIKLSNGRLQTPSMRTDDGRRVSFLIDRNGCIVRVLR